eukprot:904608_1
MSDSERSRRNKLKPMKSHKLKSHRESTASLHGTHMEVGELGTDLLSHRSASVRNLRYISEDSEIHGSGVGSEKTSVVETSGRLDDVSSRGRFRKRSYRNTGRSTQLSSDDVEFMRKFLCDMGKDFMAKGLERTGDDTVSSEPITSSKTSQISPVRSTNPDNHPSLAPCGENTAPLPSLTNDSEQNSAPANSKPPQIDSNTARSRQSKRDTDECDSSQTTPFEEEDSGLTVEDILYVQKILRERTIIAPTSVSDLDDDSMRPESHRGLGDLPDIRPPTGSLERYAGGSTKACHSTTIDQDVPPHFVCPITYEVMKNPVVLSDGHTYESTAVERWLLRHDTSPMTG